MKYLMFGISKIFPVFSGVSYAYQGCIYLIKNTETVKFWNIFAIYSISFLS